MIDAEHRAIAKAIAGGDMPPTMPDEGWHKALTYGQVARAVSQVALPSVDELLESQNPRSVSHVTALLQNSFNERCSDLLDAQPNLKYDLDWTTNKRLYQTYRFSMKDSAKASLRGGVLTAVDIENATLATILHRVQRGESITKEGLLKSQRVPFAFAMQSIAAHDIYCSDLFAWAHVKDLDGDDRDTTKILRSDVTMMSPDQGLVLTRDIPGEVQNSRFGVEPTIGCPVTLVRHFIRDFHTLAAQTCIDAGIIPVVAA